MPFTPFRKQKLILRLLTEELPIITPNYKIISSYNIIKYKNTVSSGQPVPLRTEVGGLGEANQSAIGIERRLCAV